MFLLSSSTCPPHPTPQGWPSWVGGLFCCALLLRVNSTPAALASPESLLEFQAPPLASGIRICILRSPGDSYAPSGLRVGFLWTRRRESLFPFLSSKKVWIFGSQMLSQGEVQPAVEHHLYSIWGWSLPRYLRGHQPTSDCWKSPSIPSSDFQENETKNNPQAVFPGEPLWLVTPFWTEPSLLVLLGNHWERRKSGFSWQIT